MGWFTINNSFQLPISSSLNTSIQKGQLPISLTFTFVTTLFQRVENLTSNDARENECQYVTNILKENNYPKRFLYDCLRRPTLTDCNSPEGDSAVKGFASTRCSEPFFQKLLSLFPNTYVSYFILSYFYHTNFVYFFHFTYTCTCAGRLSRAFVILTCYIPTVHRQVIFHIF